MKIRAAIRETDSIFRVSQPISSHDLDSFSQHDPGESMMTYSRRRVSFRPALEGLSSRITPSDVMPGMTPIPELPIEPPSSDIQPPDVPPTYYGDTVPPMYPPDGTPGVDPWDYP